MSICHPHLSFHHPSPGNLHNVSRHSRCELNVSPPIPIYLTLQAAQQLDLPTSSETLFKAKSHKKLSFEQIANHIGRNEVAAAAIFYGQAKASAEDIEKLASLLEIPHPVLEEQLSGFPDRGRSVEMPPREPLIYRLYEIIQNYGYAYKAVLNEKFGDGIMSAISFSTKVEKETDRDGNNWAVITLRGKWYVVNVVCSGLGTDI